MKNIKKILEAVREVGTQFLLLTVGVGSLYIGLTDQVIAPKMALIAGGVLTLLGIAPMVGAYLKDIQEKFFK